MSDPVLHPLLTKQLGELPAEVDPTAEPWKSFLQSVSESYQAKDGEKDQMEVMLDRVSKQLLSANEQLKRDAEERLDELNRYYARTLDLQEGLVLCYQKTAEGDFRHTLCRGRLCARMGYTAERVEGHLLSDILHGPLKRRMMRVYHAAWAGKIRTLEGGSKRRGVRFLALFHPRKEDDVVTEVIVSAVEVTEIKRTEQALRSAKVKAEAADKAKSNFLAVMSHEIRTPMNSVIGFTSLLRTTTLTDEQAHFVKMIEASGESLLEIINDVLDISKIEAGRLELSIEPVEPLLLANEVVAMMHARAHEKDVALNLEVSPDLPTLVRSDRARLRQILINLLGNALKFTAQGSVTLEIHYGPDERMTFHVRDTGIGIAPDGLERLFKPFSQVDSSTTRNYGGTGLGLAICKRLCEALGGGISVTSEVGKGSCFTFHVHAPAEATEAAGPVKPAAEDSTAPMPTRIPSDNPRILVVDDNPTNRKVLGMTLNAAGYRDLEYAEDGAEAVNTVRAAMPDIIFMDVEMPVLDGMEATQAIRRLPQTDAVHPWIVGLSANVWQETVKRARTAGMNHYLVKPVRRKEVSEAIRQRNRS